MHGPHRLDSFGAILSGLAKRLGLESRLVELRLQHHWRDIIGEPTGSHTWPDQIRFKKLYLVVRNSVWLQQLTFLKPAMLAKLHTETGPDLITDIVFRVGEIPASQGNERVATAAASPLVPETELTEVLSHTARIQDQALRERFTEVISRYPAPAPVPPEEGP
jgi:predicted nucleic acid-binding Zn ribbon protein